jgi:vacuolar-type H+-ATPase subunit I/STV1
MRFKKLVFRATKAQSIVHTTQHEKNAQLGSDPMTVYCIILSNSSIGKARILKICEQVSTMSFEIDGKEDAKSLGKQVQALQRRSKETLQMIKEAKSFMRQTLREEEAKYADIHPTETISTTELFRLFTLKEKILYTALNKFKKGKALYFGFCWCPDRDENKLQIALQVCT